MGNTAATTNHDNVDNYSDLRSVIRVGSCGQCRPVYRPHTQSFNAHGHQLLPVLTGRFGFNRPFIGYLIRVIKLTLN